MSNATAKTLNKAKAKKPLGKVVGLLGKPANDCKQPLVITIDYGERLAILQQATRDRMMGEPFISFCKLARKIEWELESRSARRA